MASRASAGPCTSLEAHGVASVLLGHLVGTHRVLEALARLAERARHRLTAVNVSSLAAPPTAAASTRRAPVQGGGPSCRLGAYEQSLRPHRGLRHHRRPSRGLGGHGQLDRLPLSASLRFAIGLRGPRRWSAAGASVSPLLEGAARKQLAPHTNVLLTRFLDAGGVAELSDFMPVEDAGQAHNLVRRAKTVRGSALRMRCDPLRHARATHTAERRATQVLFVGQSGDGALVLRLRSSMRLENGAALAEFTLGADTSAWFVLDAVLARDPRPRNNPTTRRAFKQTVNFWRRWVAHPAPTGSLARDGKPLGADAEAAPRGNGSIVAAPTLVSRRRSGAGATGTIATRGSRLVVHPLRVDAPRLHG